MLDYSKLILQKVSFSSELFSKELVKAMKLLSREERMLLYAWCFTTFSDQYAEVLNHIFRAYPA